MRDAAEFAADGIYMQRKQRNNQRRTDNAEQKCRQLRTAELDIKNDAERQNGDKNGRPAELSKVFKIDAPFGQKFGRHRGYIQTKHILNLR